MALRILVWTLQCLAIIHYLLGSALLILDGGELLLVDKTIGTLNGVLVLTGLAGLNFALAVWLSGQMRRRESSGLVVSSAVGAATINLLIALSSGVTIVRQHS